jgi:cobalt-zinc-cadmium efflux system membrane fusion protein
MKIRYLIICFAFILSFSSCTRKNLKEPKNTEANCNIITIADSAIKANNIVSTSVESRTLKIPLETSGEIKLNENKTYKITTMFSGLVIEENTILGSSISAGQKLASIQNPEIAKIQAGFIHEFHLVDIAIKQAEARLSLAKENFNREKKLFEEGISPKKDFYQTQMEYTLALNTLESERDHKNHLYSEAHSLLGAYGIHSSILDSGFVSNNIPIIAPRSGLLITKNISSGSVVPANTLIYEISDLSEVWLDLNIYIEDLSKIKVGQRVDFMTNAYPDKIFSGQISFIQSISISPNSIYVARVTLTNPGLLLKPGITGKALIEMDPSENNLVVPENSVQQYGKEFFVFQDLGQGKYQKHTIEPGQKIGSYYLIKSGIEPEMKIVSNGSYLLKAEMLKGTIEEE